MTAQPHAIHPSIYLLCDHLDAALAAGEDLLSEFLVLAGAGAATAPDLAGFVRDVNALELILIARVLQARRRAEEIKRSESQLRPLVSLFVGGTAPLVDAASELGDLSGRQFATGATAMAFLRARGLVAADAAGLGSLERLAVGEEYLVATRIRLGTLLDLIATFLDRLDLAFELYGVPKEPTLPMPPDAAGPVVERAGSLEAALRRLAS